MRALRLAGAMALCVMVVSGCAMSRPYKSYSDEVDSWSYPKRFAVTWKDWGMTLLDIVSLEIGAGESIGIDVQPTKILQTGFLFGDVMKLGWRNRGFGFYHEVQRKAASAGRTTAAAGSSRSSARPRSSTRPARRCSRDSPSATIRRKATGRTSAARSAWYSSTSAPTSARSMRSASASTPSCCRWTSSCAIRSNGSASVSPN